MENEYAETRANDQVSSWLWLGIGILLFAFSNGRWVIPLAAWLAPVFLLRFVRLQKPLAGLIVLFLAITLSARVMLYGIVPSLLGILTYLLIIYYALLWFLPYLVARLFSRKLPSFAVTLFFPLTAVAIEYLNTTALGSWGAIAYTQFGNLPLLQVMSVTGMWGVTFLVMWFGSLVNWVWEKRLDWSQVRGGIITYASILTAVMLLGGARLATSPAQASSVRVASFTAAQQIEQFYQGMGKKGYDSSIKMADRDRNTLHELLSTMHESMFERTKHEIAGGASIVLWPEGATRVLQEDEPKFLARGCEVARSGQAYLLLAYFVVPRETPWLLGENKSVFITPAGDVKWHYLKTHPVPGATDKPGLGIVPISDTPFGRIASVICYDMDFTNLVNQAGKASADIMLVPAWDWRAIDPLHTVMATFRAIENGFSMVRQSGEGLSIAVDYQGKVLASMDYYTAKDQHMTAQVPTKGTRTVYSYIGDTFAWLCLVCLLLLSAISLWGRLQFIAPEISKSTWIKGE